ncbi:MULTISPECIES: GNAT family N-acetyltransferase [Streptomyces]|uniref:Acetyltransferase n=1 Tax=Streptomyces albus (strain ATCC 21838 / DSM 41398 / FERM P-419 / JCM 4703 / NBRC 107858) TaxID=1081613 RepID=A0A0B5F5K9_STRA4|nr:GNAT family N-acetyltransferase [Streptomyces sp. SCSIO ZS0520]AJE85657.1 acetyltransferase [Streptomyces albus]AOU79959.1 acetyltransferase [Streptomyces albus]
MPELSQPDPRFHRSFLATTAEVAAAPGGPGPLTRGIIARHGKRWESAEGFAALVEELRGWAEGVRLPPELPVPATVLWWTEGEEHLGTLFIRHRLTPALLDHGGHLVASVRPSVRSHGQGKAMLRAALPHAHRLGVDPALLTCAESNTASRKVIEACGGRFEDNRNGSLRYWIRTGA